MCLPCSGVEGVNVYNEHTRYSVFGMGYTETFSIDKSVLIWNNPTRTNTLDVVMMYVNKICDIERTMDVNVKVHKIPFWIGATDKTINTMKKIVEQIDDNVFALFIDKSVTPGEVQVLETNAPFVCDKLADYAHDVENKLLTFLGINNSNTDKRERLVSDEVNSNNDYVEQNALLMFEQRQRACERINEMFGLSVSVKRKEVGNNEPVHNGVEGNNK
jgi:hypothetical protein